MATTSPLIKGAVSVFLLQAELSLLIRFKRMQLIITALYEDVRSVTARSTLQLTSQNCNVSSQCIEAARAETLKDEETHH